MAYCLMFGCAIGFYLFLWPQAPITPPDTGSYLRAAQALLEPTFAQLQERGPGFPLLLILTGSSQSPTRALFALSMFMHFTCIWLLAGLLYRNGLSEALLIVFGVVLILPPYAEPAGYVLSENLTEFTLVLGFASLSFWFVLGCKSWSLLSLASLAMACSALTRPAFQLLALTVAVFLCLGSYLLCGSAEVSQSPARQRQPDLVSGALIGGYSASNYIRYGYFTVTPKLGLTLTTKTVRFVELLPPEHSEIRKILIRARDSELTSESSHTGAMYIWGIVDQLAAATGMDYATLSSHMLKLNLQLIGKAPLRYLQDVIWAFGSYWLPASDELANMNSRFLQFIWGAIHFGVITLFFCTLCLCIAAGFFLNRTRNAMRNVELQSDAMHTWQMEWLFICGVGATVVMYSPLISALVEAGNSRFRVPTDSLILFVVFLGLSLLAQFNSMYSVKLVRESDL